MVALITEVGDFEYVIKIRIFEMVVSKWRIQNDESKMTTPKWRIQNGGCKMANTNDDFYLSHVKMDI